MNDSESTSKTQADDSSPSVKSVRTKVARFEELNQAYWQSQRAAWQANYEQTNNAYQTFTSALQGIKEDAQQRYAEIYANYINGQKEAMSDSNPQLRAEKLYQDFMETTRRVYENEQKLYAEAYQTYADVIQEAQKQKTADYLSAYRNYLTDLKEAWGQLDVAAVVDLTAMGHMH